MQEQSSPSVDPNPDTDGIRRPGTFRSAAGRTSDLAGVRGLTHRSRTSSLAAERAGQLVQLAWSLSDPTSAISQASAIIPSRK